MSSVQSIYINKTEMYMQVNTYDVLHVHTLPVDAEDNEIGWIIEKPHVVSLNNNIGQLRANSVGESNVTVYVKSNPSIRATCKVYVRVRIPVESISFPVPELTMNVNNTMKLGVIVSPSNATNRKVYWSSCCSDIATVDSEGVVRPQSPGIVDIYATTEDGNLTAKCTITVEKYIPVKAIRFPSSELTLKKGNTAKLNVIIEPSNATYSYVTWRSCCPEIATISSNGTVQAIKPGVVDIYATAENGSLTAKCTIKVIVDEVTIQKDDLSAEIVFNSTGKTWKCIFADMIFNEENRSNYYFNQRLWHNLYVNLSESNNEFRTYSNEELKLLYAIDPHGVAIYVESYAAENYSDLIKRIEYKDRIFTLLFRKQPLYYRRKNLQEWETTIKGSNPSEFISESEVIFGMHPIYDHITKAQLKALALDVIAFGIGLCFPQIPVGISILYNSIFNIQKNYYLYSANLDMVNILDSVIPSEAFSAFENTDPLWCGSIVSSYGSLYSILTTEISTSPNFTKNVISNCNDTLAYNMNFKLLNGQTVTIQEINDIASNL